LNEVYCKIINNDNEIKIKHFYLSSDLNGQFAKYKQVRYLIVPLKLRYQCSFSMYSYGRLKLICTIRKNNNAEASLFKFANRPFEHWHGLDDDKISYLPVRLLLVPRPPRLSHPTKHFVV
jgi:hypothetical protein